MIDRKRSKTAQTRVASAKRRFLRGVSGWFEPSKPWLARRNGISSAFRSLHMGNVGLSRSGPPTLHPGTARYSRWLGFTLKLDGY
jgi:hypothetical protein